jgi:hypothetical protein
VKVNVPKPHRSLDELRKLNQRLDVVLPGIGAILDTAKVSPTFDLLYGLKVRGIRENVDRLDQLISRHNFFDCETILELQNPMTKRKVLLIQADMDVDTDGTDGDRAPVADGGSRTFQPFTSYHWKKRTQIPNPCTPIWEKRIGENEARIKDPKTPAAEVQSLKADTARLRRELTDLRSNSYLVGSIDPFIVLPTQMFSAGKNGYQPRIGDYCVVLVGEVFYPAIIGDAGPRVKIGEASLRICRQIAATANGANRPINDLKATYLVFPGSGEKDWGPPDLKRWFERCDSLLKEFDNYAGALFQWEDLSKPPATPTPAPTPSPSPVATPAAESSTQKSTPAAKP